MKRTIRSGNVIEKSQFYVGERKPRSDRKKGSTTPAKEERNLADAVRRLARVINTNFRKGDLFITLTYSDKPESLDAASHAASLFMRRMARAAEQPAPSAPPRVRAVWVESDKSSEGSPVRLHHHMIIGADLFRLETVDGKTKAYIGDRDLADLWKLGYIDVEPLKEQDDYTPLAAYIVRQSVGGPDKKKWHSTRNLDKPIIVDEEITDEPHELRAPAGAEVHEISHYDEQTGSHYIRYTRKAKAASPDLPEIPPKRIEHLTKREQRRRL